MPFLCINGSSRTITARLKAASLLILLIPLAVVFLGCPGKKPVEILPPRAGVTEGYILVDSPEVFARERLVRDREQQKKWLKEQLSIPDEAFDAVQAQVQSRTFSSSRLSFGLDATATGELAVRQADAQAGNLAREQEVADLQHQIRLAQLQNELEKARSGESLSTPPSATETGTGTAATGSGTAASAPAPPAASILPQSPPASPTQLPAYAATTALTVKDSPVDRFRDRLAYRELVRQELLENDLDDAHDLLGNTLYRWTFDTTALPGSETSKWAVVKVLLKPTFECSPSDVQNNSNLLELLKGFEAAVERMVNFDQFAVEDLVLSGRYEGADSQAAQLAKSVARTKDYSLEIARKSERLQRFEREAEELRRTRPSTKSKRDLEMLDSELDLMGTWLFTERAAINSLRTEAEFASAQAVAEGYRKSAEIRGAATHLAFTVPDNASPQIVAKIKGDTTEARLAGFCSLVRLLPLRVDPYAVTPKESIERIADLGISAARQELLLSAALTAGTVGVESALQEIEEMESQRQAVRRQPLVVGFATQGAPISANNANGNDEITEFGWILGPRFAPRFGGDAGFDFFHKVNQVPLAAVVSVPAWWLTASVEVHTCWSDVKTVDDTLCATPMKKVKMEVKLPGDAEEVARALFPIARRPQPYLYRGSPDLEIGRSEKIVIYGENLWRNPVVWLGSQPATDVEILPDMKGIAASFEKVQQPAGWTAEQTSGWAAVWVWTSEGNAVAGDVRLFKPAVAPKANKAPALFSLKTEVPHIVLNQNNKGVVGLTFKFDQKEEKGRKTNLVDKVYLAIENAVLNPSETPDQPACLNKSTVPWEVKDSCRVEVHLQGLTAGQVITIKAHRKDGKDEINHDPITLEVRR
jgi:hypothetical protein